MTTTEQDTRALAEAKFGARIEPFCCRHLECSQKATMHVVSAFGTANVCDEHGAELDPQSKDGWRPKQFMASAHPDWLREAFRYGPSTDPVLR